MALSLCSLMISLCTLTVALSVLVLQVVLLLYSLSMRRRVHLLRRSLRSEVVQGQEQGDQGRHYKPLSR